MNQRPEIFGGLDALLAPRYSIQTEVGRGATAVVYLAEDRKHQRSVAIKLLRPELAQAVGPDRFLREIRISAGLSHPNIVPVHDSGEVAGTLYYVMPLVEGESLRARLERDGPLPLADVVTITSAVAAALDHAHAQGIVHRDLKPENILLAEGRALVADFGVARATAGSDDAPGLTEPGLAVGTPHYMSPEQAAADPRIDARSDQYSLGVVVYEMLTGEPPFRSASPRAVLARKVADEVPPIRTVRESIPRAVEDVVMRALARVPGDRFASAGAFAAALEKASTEGGRLPRGRWRWPAAAGLTLLAGSLVLTDLVSRPGSGFATGSNASPAWTVLADVAGSADADIRTTVGSLIQGTIDQSRRLVTLPASQLSLGLAGMQLPDTARLTYNIARELAQRGGIPTFVVAVLDRVGRTYSLTLRLHSATSDSLIAAVQETAASDDGLMLAVSRGVERLTSLGPSGTYTRYGAWPPVITGSFLAFQKWNLGFDYLNQGREQLGLQAFGEAVRHDPEFGVGWCWRGLVQSQLGIMNSADVSFSRAFSMPQSLSDFYRNMCMTMLALHQGDNEEADRLALHMIEQYGVNHSNRAVTLAMLGRHDEAIATLESAWSDYPFGPPYREYLNLVRWLMQSGKYERARSILDSLEDSDAKRRRLTRLAAAQGRWDEVDELVRGPARHLREAVTAAAEMHTARGRVNLAIRELLAAANPATEGPKISPLDASEAILLIAVASGDSTLSRSPVDITADTTVRALLLRGLWSLQSGDGEAARSALEATLELTKRPPRTAADRTGICMRRLLEGRERYARQDWLGAIDRLRSTTCRLDDRTGFPYRLVGWTLAEAFERANMPDSAVTRFVDMAENRPAYRAWYTPRGFTDSFARRRAALLLDATGRQEEAVEHWTEFLANFTDPDPAYATWRTAAIERLGKPGPDR